MYFIRKKKFPLNVDLLQQYTSIFLNLRCALLVEEIKKHKMQHNIFNYFKHNRSERLQYRVKYLRAITLH